MKKLTEKQKKSIIMTAGISGWSRYYKEHFGDWVITPNLTKACNQIASAAELIMRELPYTEEQRLDMVKQMGLGNYSLECLSKAELKENRRRNLASQVTVKREAIYGLGEYALRDCNKDCKKNKKLCELRKYAKELKLPEFDELAAKRGECEFKNILEYITEAMDA